MEMSVGGVLKYHIHFCWYVVQSVHLDPLVLDTSQRSCTDRTVHISQTVSFPFVYAYIFLDMKTG